MELFFSQVYNHRKLLPAFALLFFTQYAVADHIDFTLSTDKAEIRQGEELTYSVSVCNRNVTDLYNVCIADSMPKGMMLVSCSAADYTLANRNMLVSIPRLPGGKKYSFDVTVRVNRRGNIVKTLQLQANNATPKTLKHSISVLSNNVLTGKIHTLTLNGHDANCHLEIPGLLSYPNNELVVFNRYSDQVYQKRHYANDWDGSNLPAGSYYYLLTIYLDNSVVQKYNGAIAIKR